MIPFSTSRVRSAPPPGAGFLLAWFLAFALSCVCSAQTSSNGTITGRVFNPATGEYVRDAEVRVEGTNISAVTEAGGYYRLMNVPAGEVNVVVDYTGYDRAFARVSVSSGSVASQDFELTGSAATARRGDDVVTMGEFVVSIEREGNAKAIMEQKAAMNVKTVVTADTYGDVAEGNIGEFLKFMPGITLDYVETDTRAARMGGLEAHYGSVTVDGNAAASAGGFGSNSRQFEFEAMSITNIEAIEVNKTLNADLPADSPAGSINLRTRSALDRKGQSFNYSLALIGNQYEHSFSQTPRHDDERHRKLRPTLTFDYSNSFLGNKLGVAVNGSFSSVFKPQYRQSLSTDYNSATAQARQAPIITALNFKDGVKMTDKYSGGIKLDFQPYGPRLRVTLSSSYTWFSDEISNRNFAFRANAAQIDPSSTLTRIIANPTSGNGTRVEHSGGTGNKRIDTTNLALGFVYKGDTYTLDGQASYSRARNPNGSDHYNTVDRADLRLTGISWMAERESVDSTAWTITQTGGADWNDLDSYGKLHTHGGNIRGGRTASKNQQFVEQLNFKKNLPWERPTFIKTGLYHQVMVRDFERLSSWTTTYVGPTGNQLEADLPVSVADFRISPAFGGNIRSMPVPDKAALWDLLSTHPEYFTQTEAEAAGNLNDILGSNQDVEEHITAAYFMGNTRFGGWQLQAGVRYEETDTTATVNKRVPNSENPYANNTLEQIYYRWSQGREVRKGSFDDWMPSAAATYRFSDDLILKLGYHKAIKRARLDALAGQWNIDETNQRISLPNPNLKPERSQKFSAMLEYYFEPAGTVSLHLFQVDLNNGAQQTDWSPSSDFGFENDPIYSDFEFRGWENFPGTRKVKGFELNYTQQLSFLQSEFLQGTRVFATYSRQTSDPRPNNFVSQNASAGISFRIRRFNARLAGTWTDDIRTGGSTVPTSNNSYFFPGDLEYLKERYIFDVSAGYKLTQNLELFMSGRNAFNSGKTWFYKESDGRLRQAEKYGGQWTLGIKGRF